MSQIDLSSRAEKAKAFFNNSYNCSQSVAMAFADVIGIEEKDILRLMSGYGFGIGGERSVCGAVSGGVFVISSIIKDPTQRDEIYAKVKRMIDEFKAQNKGKINCLDLVGENPTDEDFNGSCPVLIEQVVRAVVRTMAD